MPACPTARLPLPTSRAARMMSRFRVVSLGDRIIGDSRRMRLWTRTCAFGAAAMLALGPVAAGAQTDDPPDPLKTVKALKCRFPVAVSGTWKNGEAVANPR